MLCNSADLDFFDHPSDICRCNSCGFIFDNPRPTFEEIQRYYSRPEQYDSWLENLAGRDKLWKRRIKNVTKWKKEGNLLDIGTGIGQFLAVARPGFSEVSGTEISDSAVEIARTSYSLAILKGKIEDISFGNKKFDNITIFHVLEHVDNPKKVIEKCHGLMTENAILFIAVPNDVASLKVRTKLFLKKFGFYKSIGKSGLNKLILDGTLGELHLSHFTQVVLKKFLETEGFKVRELSLDPYYAGTGFRKIVQDLYYYCNSVFYHMFRVNLYDTIWIVAEKTADG